MVPDIIIVGAGGHGRVVAEIVGRQRAYRVLGFIDDYITGSVNDIPVIGSTECIRDLVRTLRSATLQVLVAIGDNDARSRVVSNLKPLVQQSLIEFGQAVDPSAIISETASIGPGTVVMPKVVINANARIGNHVIINTAATVDHDSVVDDFAHLSPGVHLAGSVTIGIGSHIGTGTVAIPGSRVGAWSLVGAGSTVVEDVSDTVVAYGSPARVRRSLEPLAKD